MSTGIAIGTNALNIKVTGNTTGTDYIVQRQAPNAAPGTQESWDVIATVNATSARDAIRKAADKQAGTYVAVPKRSWTPTTVAIETQTIVKLS